MPVRIMFFMPNRLQAISIQTRIKKMGGEYYAGNAAWEYIKKETGINLKDLFENFKE